jgi:hypothetical protein
VLGPKSAFSALFFLDFRNWIFVATDPDLLVLRLSYLSCARYR